MGKERKRGRSRSRTRSRSRERHKERTDRRRSGSRHDRHRSRKHSSDDSRRNKEQPDASKVIALPPNPLVDLSTFRAPEQVVEDAELLYKQVCDCSEHLPPGWERVVHSGTVWYLDHLLREAHQQRPEVVWSRRAAGNHHP
jgi:hypothetical protein